MSAQQQAEIPSPPTEMTAEKLELLRFYREEVKHEFNLLAMRTNILVTCQSFLIVPFAILNTTTFEKVLIPVFAVAGLGIFTSAIIIQPIEIAHEIINEWLEKQRALLATVNSDLYKTKRDLERTSEPDTSKDTKHQQSVWFSKHGPYAFITFWIIAIIASLIRYFILK